MWVNIYFQAIDCHLTDYNLLRAILWRLQEGQASLTLWPEDEEFENCFSFKIRGSTELEAHAKAIEKVRRWIRCLPCCGLPFDRAEVFQSGLGLNFMAPQ